MNKITFEDDKLDLTTYHGMSNVSLRSKEFRHIILRTIFLSMNLDDFIVVDQLLFLLDDRFAIICYFSFSLINCAKMISAIIFTIFFVFFFDILDYKFCTVIHLTTRENPC